MSEGFGLPRSIVSRRFIRTSARQPKRLQERRLDIVEWIALILDENAFVGYPVVIALCVKAIDGKRILGLVRAATENQRACASFLREIEEWSLAPTGCLPHWMAPRDCEQRCRRSSTSRWPFNGGRGGYRRL
jgi:hypothetical protein